MHHHIDNVLGKERSISVIFSDNHGHSWNFYGKLVAIWNWKLDSLTFSPFGGDGGESLRQTQMCSRLLLTQCSEITVYVAWGTMSNTGDRPHVVATSPQTFYPHYLSGPSYSFLPSYYSCLVIYFHGLPSSFLDFGNHKLWTCNLLPGGDKAIFVSFWFCFTLN